MEKLVASLRPTVQGRISSQHRARFGTSDVVQECALQLIKEFQKKDQPEQSPQTPNQSWLAKIGFGNTARLIKRDRAQRRSVTRETNGSVELPDQKEAPDIIAEQREISSKLLIAISVLDPQEQDIVNRHYRNQQSLNSIAKELDLSRKKVQRIHRAIIAKLKAEITRTSKLQHAPNNQQLLFATD